MNTKLFFWLFSINLFFSKSFSQIKDIQLKKVDIKDRRIQYSGRFYQKDSSCFSFMYSGSSIKFKFKGKYAIVDIKDDSSKNYFNVFVNDSLFFVKKGNEKIVLDFTKERPKKYLVEITRRTEWHGGNSSFCGMYLDKSSKLLPLKPQKLSILFIGDSYTCGYGNEGKTNQEHFEYATENNSKTYGAITAKNLRADYSCICRSGIGLLHGYGGNKNFTQPKLYNEIIGNTIDDVTKYDGKPGIIVINLGINDFSVKVDSNEFITTYIRFINTLVNNYSKAKIICIATPTLPEEKSALLSNYIEMAVKQCNKVHKTNIYFLLFNPFIPSGSDWHPNVTEHELMAQQLSDFIILNKLN